MSYSLICVDAQKYFEAANNSRFRKNCKREIKEAMKKRAAIVFVEFQGCGPTLKELTNLTKNYDRKFFVKKDDDDGSIEVSKCIRVNGLAAKRIKVLGVNTDCCVQSTVTGLNYRLKKATIQVIADACNSDWDHVGGLSNMKQLRNVLVKE